MPDPRYNYRNMTDAFAKIIKNEGLRKTIRGINAVVGGAGPAHAMYFACYERMKKVLSGGGPQNAFHHGNIRCLFHKRNAAGIQRKKKS